MNKHNPFKLLLAVVVVIIGMAIYAGVNGQLTTLPQEILGAVAVPFQRVAASISQKVDIWQDKYLNIDEIVAENQRLKEENVELRKKQIDYDEMKIENEQYEEFLQIKKEHPNYEVVSAAVIGRDGMDKFYSFTIDQGVNAGVKKNDVVLSSQGVIGVIVEVGPNFSRVATILSPSVNVACFVSRTRDTGVISGSSQYTEQHKTILSYLPKNTLAKKGDIISTTGLGGIFPKDLVVGTIDEVYTDDSGNYDYAVITPASDVAEVRMVFVVTQY